MSFLFGVFVGAGGMLAWYMYKYGTDFLPWN